MKQRYYIAYGSNLSIDQMIERCPSAKVIGKSIIPNMKPVCMGSGGESYLNLTFQKGSYSPVGIYSLSKEDEVKLDEIETKKYYSKIETNLKVFDFRDKQFHDYNGFIYLMTSPVTLGKCSANYINTLIKGYKDFGFNLKLLNSI